MGKFFTFTYQCFIIYGQVTGFNKCITIDNNLIFNLHFSQKYINHISEFFEEKGRLTHSFLMHPFSTPPKTSENRKFFLCFQEVKKGYIRNKWVIDIDWFKSKTWLKNNIKTTFLDTNYLCHPKIMERKILDLYLQFHLSYIFMGTIL